MPEIHASAVPDGGSRLRRAAAATALVALTAWCYAPALRAYFAQDDFTLLALTRLLRQPFAPFFHDHFPGSLFFRPLGIFVWWLTTAAFDNAPRGHYAVNLALHLGCVAALYTFLQRLRRNARANLLWAAVFAVHPLAIGTALWLSDRFDLIATAFGLLALVAAIDYVRRPRARALLALGASVLTAFAAKEIAIVAALSAMAVLVLPDEDARATWRQRIGAAALVAALTVGWLAWRHALLTNPQNLLLQPDALVSIFTRGSALWLRIGFEFLALDPRRSAWVDWPLALGAVLLAAAVVTTVRRDGWRPRALGVAAALLIVIFLPGPVQAPVVILSATDLAPTTFWFDLIGESRLFYLSLAGSVAALMLLTKSRPGADSAAARRDARLPFAALALLLVAWVPASHALAHDYARRTRAQIAPLQAAHAAIARLDLPAHRCQIYLLDTTSMWGFDGLGDPIIKASSPAPQRLDHCLVNTERTSWGNFVRRGSIGAGDYRPLRPLLYRGRPVPWLDIGGFEAAYLDLDADIDARTIDDAFFLEYRDGAFVDVSAAVRSGARPVHFFNARPDRG